MNLLVWEHVVANYVNPNPRLRYRWSTNNLAITIQKKTACLVNASELFLYEISIKIETNF